VATGTIFGQPTIRFGRIISPVAAGGVNAAGVLPTPRLPTKAM